MQTTFDGYPIGWRWIYYKFQIFILGFRDIDLPGTPHHPISKVELDFREYAFYTALEVNDSAVSILGDDVLRHIAQELVETVKKNTGIDWTVRESVQAKMRLAVKKILRKHGYPPDMEAKATETVLEQARLMADRLG